MEIGIVEAVLSFASYSNGIVFEDAFFFFLSSVCIPYQRTRYAFVASWYVNDLLESSLARLIFNGPPYAVCWVTRVILVLVLLLFCRQVRLKLKFPCPMKLTPSSSLSLSLSTPVSVPLGLLLSVDRRSHPRWENRAPLS